VLEEKVGAIAGDRAILRDPSATRTMAGALVIDPFGPPRHRRTARRLAELGALAAPDFLPKLLALDGGHVDLARLGRAHNLREAETERLLQEAVGVRVQGYGFLQTTLDAVRRDIADTLAAFHKSNADAPGLQPERLRVALKQRWPAPVFRALLEREVAAKTVALAGGFAHLPGHALTLAPREAALWKKIAAELERERFRPPRVRDFAQAHGEAEPNVRKLLRQMARLGRVVEVAPDQFFLRPVVAEMIAIANALGPDFTAAQFRDRLDNGRKVAIQILEFFDRHGITLRRGDLRRTVPQKLHQYGPPPG
jgi:selenocysteine-specific elongation factor